MLTQSGFVRWAREHLVVLVVHNELGHEEREGLDAYGRPARLCTLYPGLSCRQHLDAAVDVDNAREDGLVQVPFVELCPNTWFVLPTGTVEAVPEEEQFVAGKVEAQGRALQKGLGAALGRAEFERLDAALRRGDEALDQDRPGEALAAWAGCEKVLAPPHAALLALVEERLAAAEEAVGYAFEDLAEPGPRDPRSLEERIRAAEGLYAATATAVYGRLLPVRERIATWLAAQGRKTPEPERK